MPCFTVTVERLNAVADRFQTSRHRVEAIDSTAAIRAALLSTAGPELRVTVERDGHDTLDRSHPGL